ncbi:hypothetical protein D5801_26330 [Salmonella enterica subsp. enterica]|nr:hypothetical protein [Salmonella enterica subsp. enterica]EDP8718347.1 hypothetical protein [Salmonella enterica subsp. enterica]
MLRESGFTHGDLLRRYNQYVGRSLKVNGSFCRDAYKSCVRYSRLGLELKKTGRDCIVQIIIHQSTACHTTQNIKHKKEYNFINSHSRYCHLV